MRLSNIQIYFFLCALFFLIVLSCVNEDADLKFSRLQSNFGEAFQFHDRELGIIYS